MAQSCQEQQRQAILRLLNIGGSQTGEPLWGGAQTWKVLIYDKFCQEIVAPLLKVGGLRNHGVTVHWNIATERSPVADTPAVYFVEPTEANIKKISEDLANGLYENCYVNFASAVPRQLLEELAKGALEGSAAQKVAGVFDRYVSFVSLGPQLFTLNLPAAYSTIHSPSIADNIIQAYIERIVDGLLSVIITMQVLPVIRCPANEAAEMVARRLEERIRELMNRGGSAAAELFSSAAVGSGAPRGGDAAASSQRPLLCILDRDVDLVTMIGHTWTYQAMAHDVLGMRLNRLTVPVDATGDEAAPPKAKSYDVDEGDTFWAAHAGEPFPQVATAVHESIEEFERKRAEMATKGEGEDPSQAMAPGLLSAINALPEMTEKKRIIDMHTNIATALLNEVKARQLDRYYELEDQVASQSLNTSVTQLQELLNDRQQGTTHDKLRTLMVLYLTKPNMTPQQLDGLVSSLQEMGGETCGVDFLKQLAQFKKMMVPTMSTSGPATEGGAKGALAGAFGGLAGNLAGNLLATGEGLLASGISNLKNIVAHKKELVICQILESLMEQKQSPLTDNYIYLDPKAPPSRPGVEVPRIRAPFRRAFVFVVGGGNYVELQCLQEWAQTSGRQVVYGATDLVSPTQFVEELSHLGQAHGGGGGSSADLS
eukprot:TRINITY_DN22440_c0_g1_i1.p1 TRINITY_DN22440_c0_g1~~TRINITY_DN22440_c0_g1_i1.p1  ORF type:complete len:655 (+),score=137.53 TRINITY_DN22440_c0_g1_i1:134-2098(+)